MIVYIIRGTLIGLIIGFIMYAIIHVKLKKLKNNRMVLRDKERRNVWKWILKEINILINMKKI